MDLKPDDTAQAIVPVLACVLNQLCTRNDRLPMSQKGISKFHALRPPAISIKEYLTRIAKYAACSGECFVLALVYIDRVIQSNPTFVVNSLNIHRLLITSVMLAAKFFDDQYFNNAYFAKVGGVPCTEMNSLEVEFLFMTNFTLFVATDTYKQYYTELCNHATNGTCGCSTTKVPTLELDFPEDNTPINSPLSSTGSLTDTENSGGTPVAPSRRVHRGSSSGLSSNAPEFTPAAAQQQQQRHNRNSSTGSASGAADDGKMMDSPQMNGGGGGSASEGEGDEDTDIFDSSSSAAASASTAPPNANVVMDGGSGGGSNSRRDSKSGSNGLVQQPRLNGVHPAAVGGGNGLITAADMYDPVTGAPLLKSASQNIPSKQQQRMSAADGVHHAHSRSFPEAYAGGGGGGTAAGGGAAIVGGVVAGVVGGSGAGVPSSMPGDMSAAFQQHLYQQQQQQLAAAAVAAAAAQQQHHHHHHHHHHQQQQQPAHAGAPPFHRQHSAPLPSSSSSSSATAALYPTSSQQFVSHHHHHFQQQQQPHFFPAQTSTASAAAVSAFPSTYFTPVVAFAASSASDLAYRQQQQQFMQQQMQMQQQQQQPVVAAVVVNAQQQQQQFTRGDHRGPARWSPASGVTN